MRTYTDALSGIGIQLDCRFDETVARDLVIKQWDQMVRFMASLKNRLAPPEASWNRIVKTEHILRHIHDG